jgi:hypothetical protein
MRKLAIIVIVLFSCTSPDKARSTLEVQGFTRIKLTGYSMQCSDSDDTCTGFEATSVSGRRISGAVGCGYNWGGCGKGCTVRINP